MENSDIENKIKGDDFEKWVVKKFNPAFFEITEWRSDKFVDGIYPKSSRFPDFEICFNLRSKQTNIKHCFALECKWRNDFFRNGIEWARPYQIKNYREFATSHDLTVFVILGVGGSPLKPEYVFIIPLNQINSHFLSSSFLEKYCIKESFSEFFYDHKNRNLLPFFKTQIQRSAI